MKSAMTWENPHNLQLPPYKDPRIPIARHMDWSKTHTKESYLSQPEPDNYNRSLCAKKPIECKFIKDQVFYKDYKEDLWWTVYYVPETQEAAFDVWVRKQNFLLYWHISKATKVRPRVPLLAARKNSDITDNERLFTMGYYAKLNSKYFSELSEDWLLAKLGPVRTEILTDGLE